MINLKQMGMELRRRREERGVSLERVAEAVDVSRRRLMDIENGKVQETGICLVSRVCDYLGCSVDDLASPHDTSDVYDERVFKSNYLYANPYCISTFVQLFLVLPLIGLDDLYECFRRVGGGVIDNEGYISQLITHCYRDVPASPEKAYVDGVLRLINGQPWEERPDEEPMDVLWGAFQESVSEGGELHDARKAYENRTKTMAMRLEKQKDILFRFRSIYESMDDTDSLWRHSRQARHREKRSS